MNDGLLRKALLVSLGSDTNVLENCFNTRPLPSVGHMRMTAARNRIFFVGAHSMNLHYSEDYAEGSASATTIHEGWPARMRDEQYVCAWADKEFSTMLRMSFNSKATHRRTTMLCREVHCHTGRQFHDSLTVMSSQFPCSLNLRIVALIHWHSRSVCIL